MAFPIPDGVYEDYLAAHAAEESGDLHAPCAVLERVVSRLRSGAAPRSGHNEIDAACHIWHFFNPTGDSDDDIVVVDHVGDGMSMEFAPMAAMTCSLASESCTCRHGGVMAEPVFA